MLNNAIGREGRKKGRKEGEGRREGRRAGKQGKVFWRNLIYICNG